MEPAALTPLNALAAYVAVGALAGILAGLLGVGGGLIIVPALIWAFRAQGVDDAIVVHLAVGTSLATIVPTSLSAVYAHHRRGAVLWDLVARLAPGIVLGAWLGAALADMLPTLWLQRTFAVFALGVGARMLVGWRPEGGRGLPGAWGLAATGTGIGGLSALVGIGGGSLTVPFLAWCGVGMRGAVATSSACGLPIALAGSLGFAAAGWGDARLPPEATGYVHGYALIGVAAASASLAPFGAWLAHRLRTVALRRVFAVLLLVIGGRMLL
ncbi:MAG: sulfite exporter TauE/SafE family protein [Chromatiales bacterium]